MTDPFFQSKIRSVFCVAYYHDEEGRYFSEGKGGHFVTEPFFQSKIRSGFCVF